MKLEPHQIISIVLVVLSYAVTTALIYAGYYENTLSVLRPILMATSMIPFFIGQYLSKKRGGSDKGGSPSDPKNKN